jgi:O-antigen/teichoic acid export membrane protein
VGGLALLAALAGGAGLWSLAAGYLARVLFALLWQRRRLPPVPPIAADSSGVDWASTWRFQWKLGVSAISAFLLLQLLGPLLFAVAGPAVAGRVGLAMTLCNGVYGLSTGWLVSQAPAFGRLVAQGKQAELDARFGRVLRASLLFSAGIATVVTASVLALAALVPSLAQRLPPALVLVPIMAAAVAHHYIFALATYLRAERQEPMLGLYVGGSLVTAAGLALAATIGSPVAVAVAYLGLILAGALVATAIVRSRAPTRRPAAPSAALPASPAPPPRPPASRG